MSGGKPVSRNVDLETMPIYVRAGAIIPLDPIRQYMTEPVHEPTTIRIYSGASGRSRWYEDDGGSQEYLKGMFAWTNFQWDDVGKRLTIERDTSVGHLALQLRKLVVQLLPEGKSKEISYDGRKTEISF